MKIIAQGAEAKIIEINTNTLKKLRLPKPYRLETLDYKLRKKRNKREFKILTKLQEYKINSPKPFELIETKEEISFTFEFINGNILKDVINKELLEKAFENIIKLHQNDIVHGDLTTLNMIISENKVFLIDFGLGEFTKKIEDKAVDLNLFFSCIKNEHPDLYEYKSILIDKYLKKVQRGEEIIKRLEKIEHRGRNK